MRALRRSEQSLFNCACSAVQDARFVASIVGLYVGLPCYANLRAGLWHVAPPPDAAATSATGAPPPVPTCYFKSTDGHHGNWKFSTTRLNLHVAQAAARAGGAVVVDATRRGKTFPDALTKTLPCWAAVLNRAVAEVRRQQQQQQGEQEQQQQQQHREQQQQQQGSAAEWDTDVHLPPWVPDHEAHQIRQRLEGWAASLLEVRGCSGGGGGEQRVCLGPAVSANTTTLPTPPACAPPPSPSAPAAAGRQPRAPRRRAA